MERWWGQPVRPVARAGNKLWPLPADYPTLTEAGRRGARVNACRLSATPDEFVASWAFFREYYLFGTPKGEWYKHGIKPSPIEHYQMVRDLGQNPFNAWAAPRSFAKSTVLGREIPLKLALTRPNFETVIFMATGRHLTKTFDMFMVQIAENSRIVDDFGKLKPPRGKGMWNHGALKLQHGGAIYGVPIGGKSLGERPNLLIFDDVEFDDELVLHCAERTEAMDRFLTSTAIPMMEEGTCLGVIGTLHSRRFFIYYMMTSKEQRWKQWNRRLITVERKSGAWTWPEKLGGDFLESQRKLMTPSAFRANYYNTPGTESDRLLYVHPLLNTFEIDTSEDSDDEPLTSRAALVSYRATDWDDEKGLRNADIVRRPLGETVSKMYRIACVDYASTTGRHSDYSCIMVMGFESSDLYKDVLWVLDLFIGKVKDDELVQRLWAMAEKWGVHVCGVEAIGLQVQLAERIDVEFGDRVETGGWRPRVLPVRYPARSPKSERIGQMQWRFNQYRVKIRDDLRTEWPWRELYRQIEFATADLALLTKDDAVDALAMHQYVVRPRRAVTPGYEPRESATDPRELLKAGELFHDTGIPAITSLMPGELDQELVEHMRANAFEDEDERALQPRTWRTVGDG